jgi:hypothetical protein
VRWLRILFKGIEPVLGSTELLSEYRSMLLRKIGDMDASEVDDALATILSHAHVLEPPLAEQEPPDPDAHLLPPMRTLVLSLATWL